MTKLITGYAWCARSHTRETVASTPNTRHIIRSYPMIDMAVMVMNPTVTH
jgi:hypothetical protein